MVDTASTLWSTLPHSLAAGRVQLKLLENAIFKAEQELEAGIGGAGRGCWTMRITLLGRILKKMALW